MKPFFEDLLVKTRSVESGLSGEFDISAQCLVGRRSPDAVRVEPLVENQSQIDRFVVQIEFPVCRMNFTESGVGCNPIRHISPGVRDGIFDVIEERILRRPGPDLRKMDRERGSILRNAGIFRSFAVDRDFHMQTVFCGGFVKFRLKGEGSVIKQRDHPAGLQGVLRDRFHPAGLPDSGRACVMASGRAVGGGLFPARLRMGADIIENTENKVNRIARGGLSGDVKGEGDCSAEMFPHTSAVDESFAFVIHSSEVQKNAFAFPLLRNGEFPMVEHRRNEIPESDAGEFAFRTERDKNLSGKACGVCQSAFDAGI